MAGASGQHLPVVARAEAFEGVGDLARRRPGDAVVIGPDVKGPHVLEAEDQMDGAVGLAGHGDGIVISDLAGRGQVLRKCDGVLHFRPGHGRDDPLRGPSLAAISGAAQDDIDGAPVATLPLAGFSIGEYRTLIRDDQAGDAIESVVGEPRSENVRLFKERGRGQKARREKTKQTTEHGNYRILRFSRIASR